MQKLLLKGVMAELPEDTQSSCNDIIASLHTVTDAKIEEIKSLKEEGKTEEADQLEAALGCALGIFGIETTEQLEDMQ